MSKQIDIEYCGAWGYGGPATRLKDFISKNYGENVEIKTHSAGATTGTIKVSWIKGGALATVWEKNKAETEAGHAQILAALKANAWLSRLSLEWKIEKWGGLLKLGKFFEEHDYLFHKITSIHFYLFLPLSEIQNILLS